MHAWLQCAVSSQCVLPGLIRNGSCTIQGHFSGKQQHDAVASHSWLSAANPLSCPWYAAHLQAPLSILEQNGDVRLVPHPIQQSLPVGI